MSDEVFGEIETSMAKFVWRVENFSRLGSNVDDFVKSPSFEMKGNLMDSKWYLELYPYGSAYHYEEGIVTVMLLNDTDEDIGTICCELIISDVNRKLIFSKKCIQFIETYEICLLETIKRGSFIQKLESSSEDTLIITCIIYMDAYSEEEEVDIDKKILNNYESLLSNDSFSDVTINIKDRHIKAHKNILSARSKVFAAMFRHNMQESNSSITVTDASYNVMKEFMLFIYAGKVKDLKKNAKALLPLADKYEIDELKVLCEKYFRQILKIDNACDILLTADLYNCENLKSHVTDYIMKNIKLLNNTSKFKNMNRSNPELFEKIMFAL